MKVTGYSHEHYEIKLISYSMVLSKGIFPKQYWIKSRLYLFVTEAVRGKEGGVVSLGTFELHKIALGSLIAQKEIVLQEVHSIT